jgi:hypothetical protein
VIPFIIIVVFNNIAGATFTEIAGDLPKVLSVDKSPYLVNADVFVPAGKVVRIEPGTVLLFKNFTGLHVFGILIVQGTKERLVTFSSESDKEHNPGSNFNPTPYDWNGIYIRKDGLGTDLQNITVKYSVKGIVSETRFIRIENGFFNENGRSNLSIENEEKQVVAGTPYKYSLSTKDAVIDGVPVKILQDPEAKKRIITRYAGVGLFVGGTAVAAYFANDYRSANRELKRISDKRNQNNLLNNNTKLWHDARSRYYRDIFAGSAGFAVSLFGAVGFAWSFTF